MQCKCGGEAITDKAVQNKLKARLSFYVCKVCHTVSSAQLFIDGRLVSRDPEARQHFNSLTQELAGALLLEASIKHETPGMPADRFEQPRLQDDGAPFATGCLF